MGIDAGMTGVSIKGVARGAALGKGGGEGEGNMRVRLMEMTGEGVGCWPSSRLRPVGGNAIDGRTGR